jgi:hypothetical protein
VQEHGRQPVNLTDCGHEGLGITCREVSSIELLVHAATGHRFERSELGEPRL